MIEEFQKANFFGNNKLHISDIQALVAAVNRFKSKEVLYIFSQLSQLRHEAMNNER